MKPLLLLLILCGCASVRGEGGKFLLHEEVREGGSGCGLYLGKRVVLKCRY